VGSIAVVFGGPSPEHDISILTGLQAGRLLRNAGRDVALVYWAKNGGWWRVPGEAEAAAFLEPEITGATPLDLAVPGGFRERKRLKSAELAIDVVLNCCHGGPGEDGTLTGLLMLAGLSVSGPQPAAAAQAMDKLATAAVCDIAGIPTIRTALIDDGTTELGFVFPWVVKPRFGGSSLGVEAGVGDLETAKALARSGTLRGGAIAQPHLDGWSDLNIAVRTHPRVAVSAIEKPLRTDGDIYDYRKKYLSGADGMESAPRELPADIPDNIASSIEGGAIRIVREMGLTGAPRVDFLWDGRDRVVLCEVNAIPGALGLYLWQAAGVAREQVLDDMLTEAKTAGPRPFQWVASSDGTALRVAGSVASKLA